MHRYATKILETLAKATWERIFFGEVLDCSQGEETITDINLLDIKRAATSGGYTGMHILKTNKADEAKFGIDWEWWIGSHLGGWWRYAVQAKKLLIGTDSSINAENFDLPLLAPFFPPLATNLFCSDRFKVINAL